MAELCAAVCDIHQPRLERTRLLWELYVIDGLAGGKVAIYAKVHHGIIDGRTFVNVVSNWLSTSPRDRMVRALWEGVSRAPHISGARASLVERAGRALRSATGVAESAVGLSRLLARQSLSSAGLARGMALPILNVPRAYRGEASAQRSFAYCTLPLAEVKAVAKAHGATVNDVLLATLDMAMSRDLNERKQLPRSPLVADMPLALQDARGGNQIAVLQFPLGRPGTAPIERIAAIRREAGHVKDIVRKATAETVMLYTTLVHGFPALLERLGARSPAVSNVLVSNPFGLTEERYLMGARAELVLPMSVVAAGQMLNVTAVTLADTLQLGLLAMPHAVPDVDALASFMVDAFEQLKRATAGSARGRPATKRAIATHKRAVPRRARREKA
jgi:diacylglycerol O-acyltransferase / wax synthase